MIDWILNHSKLLTKLAAFTKQHRDMIQEQNFRMSKLEAELESLKAAFYNPVIPGPPKEEKLVLLKPKNWRETKALLGE